MAELRPTVNIVSTPEGLHDLTSEWDGLLDQSAQRSFFLRAHWIRAWWTHLAPDGAELWLVCCRDDAGTLVGLAPLYLAARPVVPLVCVRELHLLGTGGGVRISEHVDAFSRPGWEPAVAEAVAAALTEQPGWDRLSLDSVPAESAIARRLTDALAVDGEACANDRAPYIDTAGGWDAYKRSLGRSMRRNVEYYARRLFRQHSCGFELVTTAAEARAGVEDLIRLHQARWRSAGESGSFADPPVARFLRDAAETAFAAGRLRLWRLRVDGQVEAALIGFAENRIVHYFQAGFNPAYASADLGTVTVALAVKACCEDPAICAFDFMGGRPGYKSLWARQERVLMRHQVWRPNLRTWADRRWARSRAAAARVYRAAAPRGLREARRRWLDQRRPARA